MHELMAATLDTVIGEIQRIKLDARRDKERPRWPMIVLRTPKGWTCPKEIDGKRTEGYWRSHQVPMGEIHRQNPAHVRILEDWMKATDLRSSSTAAAASGLSWLSSPRKAPAA